MKIKNKKGEDEEVPYGPIRYKKIVEELYFISHQIHTSYADLLMVTPLEKKYMLGFIKEELDKQKEANEKAKRKIEENKKNK